MTKPLFIAWHLGLGDALICNGLVRVMAERHAQVVVPAKHANVPSVRFMFSDLANVRVAPVGDNPDVMNAARGCNVLGLGLWAKRGLVMAVGWDRQFYEDAGLPFEVRWARFAAPTSPQVPAPVAPYAFVHHQPEQRRAIRAMPALPVYEPPRPPHIFYHVAAIAAATEIHVVNSCFLNLVESMGPLAARRLVLHNYARTDCGPPTLHKPWEILNKP